MEGGEGGRHAHVCVPNLPVQGLGGGGEGGREGKLGDLGEIWRDLERSWAGGDFGKICGPEGGGGRGGGREEGRGEGV